MFFKEREKDKSVDLSRQGSGEDLERTGRGENHDQNVLYKIKKIKCVKTILDY